MKIERVISWFNTKSEELVGELNIDHIELKILKEIFNPPQEDYLMYNPYDIHNSEANELKKYINIEFDFNQFTYQIDCFQIN